MGAHEGEFDFIVVGGGTSGCVLANRLSADPRNRVLLLEAGGRDSNPWIHVPVGYLFCIGNPATDWCWSTQAEPGLNGRVLGYPRGKVLGGCSSINGMIAMRGQAADYDHWRQLGNPGWGWDDVLPLFRKTEDWFAGADEHHGSGGEWRVEEQRLHWPLLDAFRDAAVAWGLPRNDDFNRGDNFGVGYFKVNQKRGLRWNAARAFLRPALDRSNLRVVTRAMVDRVLLEGRRATGVVWRHGAEQRQARAGAVILASGAVASPVILERSGIGDGNVLRACGIEPVHHLPGVGGNLQDHLQLRCAWKVNGAATLNTRAASLWRKALMGLEYALYRSGPLAMAPSQLGAFVRSRPEVATPDLQYHVQPLSLDRFGEPLHAFDAFTASVCHLRPESRGSVHLASGDPGAMPLIRPNYLATEADRQTAVRAIRLTREIVAQQPLARYRPEEFRPGPEYASDEELVRAAGDVGTTIFHPVGTARMGSDPLAVVDAELRVHGIEGLRIADASIMPTITSGNTATPVVMIAEKAAALLLRR